MGREPTEMLVSWRTNSSPCPSRVWVHRASGPSADDAAQADAALRASALRAHQSTAAAYGDDGSSNAVVGESFLLSNTDMCGSPANSRAFARHLHRARLRGLMPSSYYRYAVDGGGGGGNSFAEPAIFGFRAAPTPSSRASVSLAVVGDVGWGHHARSKSPGADAVLRALAADVGEARVDAVVHVGDVAYADGDVEVWDGFMASIGGEGGATATAQAAEADDGSGGSNRRLLKRGRPSDDDDPSHPPVRYGALAARAPYLVNVGNHEYSYEEGWDHTDPSGGRPYSPSWSNWGNDSGGECGSMVARRFWMPRSGGYGGGYGGESNGLSPPDQQDQEHPHDLDLLQPQPGNARTNSSGGNDASSPGLRRERPLPPFWYSFDYGSVHVSVVSSEHDLSPGSRQAQWLEDDLASVDRCATPWLVLAIHRPLLVVLPHKSNRYVGDHLRAFLDPLLRKYRVDAAVSGHVHAYYRSCPVVASAGGGEDEGSDEGGSSGRCVDERDADGNALSLADSTNRSGGGDDSDHEAYGTVHLVVGSGGHKLSGARSGQPRWVRAVFDREYGYLRLHAEGADTLAVEFVSPASEGGEGEWSGDDGDGGDEGDDVARRRVLDRAVYRGGRHHEAACRESTARLRREQQEQMQQQEQAVY